MDVPALSVQVTSFFDEVTSTCSHIIYSDSSADCAIVDSVLDYDPASGRTDTGSADKVIHFIRSEELEVKWILETHAHADHLSAAPYLQQELGGKIGIGGKITQVQHTFSSLFNLGAQFAADGSQFDHLFEDQEVFSIGGLEAKVLATPGHTPACVSYQVGDAVFVGDTLFMPDYGTARCDFPGGDAVSLYQSISRLLSLPEETRLFLCHDYMPGGREPIWQTTVGEQRRKNIHIHEGVSEQQFVSMRTERDATLGVPGLLIPSIQVNIRAGHLPEPESNGVCYLKVPLNKL